MSKELDRLPFDVGCLPKNMTATLISTKGTHCEVWQCMGMILADRQRWLLDFVIKRHRIACSKREVEIYQRDYRKLRTTLGSIVPNAVFTQTCIREDGSAGQNSVVVLAEAVTPWFNIANPIHEADAVPLLARLSKARKQLQHFVEAATRWWQEEGKVIDLYGADNLVLDKNQEIRYLDSFNTFFYEDLLYVLEQPDEGLRTKIQISLKRLQYLRFLLVKANEAQTENSLVSAT